MTTLAPNRRPEWRPSLRLWIGVFVLVTLGVLLGVLASVPVEQTRTIGFGYGPTDSPDLRFGYDNIQTLCPAGANATVQYSSNDVEANVTVYAPSGAVILTENATNWTAFFTVASCGSYAFSLFGYGPGSLAFSVTLTYRGPLLLP